MRDKATSILSWKFVKECSVGKTNADVKISLLSLKSKGAEQKKMDLPCLAGEVLPGYWNLTRQALDQLKLRR
jgi:hypothetical protein